MAELLIRAYNVGFGDAIYMAVPEREADGRETVRHVLIDLGNVMSGPGGDDSLFLPVVDDIVARCAGTLDLYVLSHEHLDHAQGLPYAARHNRRLRARHVWLPASAAPDYYERFPEARRKRRLALRQLETIQRLVDATPRWATPYMTALLANNNPYRTQECVDFLRGLSEGRPAYVWRGMPLRAGTDHPFSETRPKIWAPEQDSSIYYGRLEPLAAKVSRRRLPTPAGVTARHFRRLLRSWQEGLGDNMLTIDRAANNSSVVFSLDWRGWRLLFTGDAELRSWRTMATVGALQPVHFLKVGHHGSHNATPPDDILEQLLPAQAPDQRPRRALVSTRAEVYGGVPHEPTLGRISARCDELVRTQSAAQGEAVELVFSGAGLAG